MRIVIALGGNALLKRGEPMTCENQRANVRIAAEQIAKAYEGNELIISHGNGPQVGLLALQNNAYKPVPMYPLDVIGGESLGMIGYMIQQELVNFVPKSATLATVLTQTQVDPKDPAFQNPTKPVGAFLTEEEAKKLAEEKGYTVKEDAGRGWRRVVPSPKPVDILEKDTIDSLLGRSIVITCGGGGIPVVKKADGTYEGVAAVIDKDFAAEALAEHVNADVLLILTEVEHVAINFGKPNQENLEKLTAAEARKYMAEGQFAPGSMLPKVEAAVKFVEAKPGKRAIISSLYHAVDAIEGNTGTEIC